MDIKYFSDGKSFVKAVGLWDSPLPEKVDLDIACTLIAEGFLKESDIVLNPDVKLTAYSKVMDGDVFDYEKGREIARDKLLVKYNKELERTYNNYAIALEKYMKYFTHKKNVSSRKISNAKSRLNNI